jgi:hypothetical protein
MADEQVFELPPEQERRPVDRYEEMSLRYNYQKELREVSKPSLYGPGVDFYEEERIRQEQIGGYFDE